MRLLIILSILAYAFPTIFAAGKWAVLVATSKTWLYYRHQSTLMHAYHTLVTNGFKKSNIITMFYDDIANHPRNPTKGIIRNHPEGPDVYNGMKKDYTGNKATAENFMAILNGDASTAKGPVVKSGPKDHVFIYIVGLGASQYLTFPVGPGIAAQKFVDILKKMRSDKRARKIYVNLEVSYGASIVGGLIPKNDNIFVSVGTHYDEIPPAVYCYRKEKICYGSLYGCAWTQRSDRLRQLKFGRKASLFDQFNYVRTLTVYSHVNIFGHLDMGRTHLKDFLGYKLIRKRTSNSNAISQLGEAALNNLEKKMDENEDNDEYNEQYEALNNHFNGEYNESEPLGNLELDLNAMQNTGDIMHGLDILPAFMEADNDVSNSKSSVLEKRDFVKNTMKDIVSALKLMGYNVDYENLGFAKPLTQAQADIYHSAIQAFDSECFNVNENTYSFVELSKLAKLAEMEVKLDDQIKAMQSVCNSQHREAKHIH